MFDIPVKPVRSMPYPVGGRPRPQEVLPPYPGSGTSPLPRPVYRSLSVLRVVVAHAEGQDQDGGLCSRALEKTGPSTQPTCNAMLRRGSGLGDFSLRALEDDARLKWAGVDHALCVAKESSVLCELQDRNRDQLLFLFSDRSAGTLRKHLPGWRLWLAFCQGAHLAPANVSLASLLDFLDALATGAKLDRGKGRCGRAKGVVQALRFVARKLGLESLQKTLGSAPVVSWLASSKWTASTVREALPLPLFAVIQLEQALSSCEPGDWWPILCFLLMLWAGLRWSDAQRLDFESVILDGGSVRGWCMGDKDKCHWHAVGRHVQWGLRVRVGSLAGAGNRSSARRRQQA